jgi:IS5 family transposase
MGIIGVPLTPSSLTRWRKRIGEEGVATMLMATIKAGRKLGLLKAASTDRVIVDTTVMPKAVAHPTDSRTAGFKRCIWHRLSDPGAVS